MAGITNWVHEDNRAHKAYNAQIALDKAKRMEKEKTLRSYKYITFGGKTKILMEVDEEGEPVNQEKFNRYTEMYK